MALIESIIVLWALIILLVLVFLDCLLDWFKGYLCQRLLPG